MARDLSDSIVIVSKFGANAGSTPRNYILNYAARNNATEGIRPYNNGSISDCMKEYRDLIEMCYNYDVSEDELNPKDLQDDVTPKSSRIFGVSGLFYDEDMLATDLDRIDNALDDAHTLISPVFSFRHTYLREHNVFPEGLARPTKENEKGAYMGNVDHLKMRRAVSRGMKGLTQSMDFVDPVWVATVQMDTLNVHVHCILIETAPFDKIPKKRLVYDFEKELVTKINNQGVEVQYEEFVRDENGNPKEIFLGERGKISDRDKDAFRTYLDKELFSLRKSKPFVNNMYQPKNIVKDTEKTFTLDNNKMQFLLSKIYNALPKELPEEISELDESASDEERLLEAQSHWLVGSNALFMTDALDASSQLVDYLLQSQYSKLKLKDFDDALNQYSDSTYSNDKNAKSKFKNDEYDKLSFKLQQLLLDDLKSVRVYTDDTYSEILFDLENQSLDSSEVSDRPFSDYNIQFIKAEPVSDSASYKLLSDSQLKNLVAHSFDDPSLSPGFEWRIRSYSQRFEDAARESEKFKKLLDDFDYLDKRKNVSKASFAMRDLYETEFIYQTAIKDKYGYLNQQKPSRTYDYKGSMLPVPFYKGLDSASEVDWSFYSLEFKTSYLSLSSEKNLTKEDVLILEPEKLDSDLIQSFLLFSGKNNVFEIKPEYLSDEEAVMFDAFCNVYEYVDFNINYEKNINKDRFDDVKYIDIIHQIYDISPDEDRFIDKNLWEAYSETVTYRHNSYKNALVFLEETNQSESDAYFQYNYKYEQLNEELEFIDYVNLSQTAFNETMADDVILLPKPSPIYDLSYSEPVQKPLLLNYSNTISFISNFIDKSKDLVKNSLEAIKQASKGILELEPLSYYLSNVSDDCSTYNEKVYSDKEDAIQLIKSKELVSRVPIQNQTKYLEKTDISFSF